MTDDLETRDFLLRSLDDLEAEYAAGDLDDIDYRTLKADYTRRAADAIRGIAGAGPAMRTSHAGRETQTRGRAIAWTVAVLAVALVAGLLLARFSGSRGSGETITGDIRTSTRELLADAQQAFGAGDLPGAIEIYDEVLQLQPSNAEALAYQGWLVRLSGDPATAQPLVDDAVAIDPAYPDARVFAAVIALDLGDVDAAAAHLAAFDQLDAPAFMRDLVVQQGLRERVGVGKGGTALEAVDAAWPDRSSPFSESGLDVATVLDAAEELAQTGEVFAAITLVEAVVSDRPDDVEALTGYAWLLARSATPEEPTPAELSLTYLDRALGIDGRHADALVYRAFVHAFLGNLPPGSDDLSAYDALPVSDPALDTLIDTFDLRGQLAG